MRRRLPPIQALIALEASARHLNFRRTAAELSLTHGAISHQIRNLEDALGVQLFHRKRQRLILTEQGQVLAMGVRQALRLIDQKLGEIEVANKDRVSLVTTVLPAFAALWLLPRLASFVRYAPNIDLFLKPSSELADFSTEIVDVGIRYGSGRYAGLKSAKLATERIFPVCSPNLNKGHLPRKISDLPRHVLIRNTKQPWVPWFQAAGLDEPEPKRGPVIEDAALALKAAQQGLGIALARRTLVKDELKAGTLIRLFDVDVQDRFSYWLVWPETSPKRQEIGVFQKWLADAFAEDR